MLYRTKLSIVFVFLFVLGSLFGCAAIEPTPVKNFDNPEGIPFYDGSHYLLVYPDGKGNLKWSLQFLADHSKKREFRSSNFLSSVSATLTFTNGLLTTADTTADSSALTASVVGAIEKVITAGIANDLARGTNVVPGPLIYKLIVEGNNIKFVGDTSNQTIINVSVTSPPKKED